MPQELQRKVLERNAGATLASHLLSSETFDTFNKWFIFPSYQESSFEVIKFSIDCQIPRSTTETASTKVFRSSDFSLCCSLSCKWTEKFHSILFNFNANLLLIIGSKTLYAITASLRFNSADSVADALYINEFLIYGIPHTISLDCSQYANHFYLRNCAKTGTHWTFCNMKSLFQIGATKRYQTLYNFTRL